MKIYIDSEYHCHTTNPDGTFKEVETPFFDGKCPEFIEGHVFVPSGNTVFQGGMITTWKPYSELDAAQREYERQLLAECEARLANQETTIAELDSLVLNLQYNNLINK